MDSPLSHIRVELILHADKEVELWWCCAPTCRKAPQRVLPGAVPPIQHVLRHLKERLEEAMEAMHWVLKERVQLSGQPPAWHQVDTLHRWDESFTETTKGRRSEEGEGRPIELRAVLEDVLHSILHQPKALLQVLKAPLLPLLPIQQIIDALTVHPDGEGRGAVEELLQLQWDWGQLRAQKSQCPL